MKKYPLTVLTLLIASALLLLTSCTDEKTNIAINESCETNANMVFEASGSDAKELLGGDYIASLDFTGCKIGLIECHGDQAEIVEYLSENDTADFVDCIKNANISSVRSTSRMYTEHISCHRYEVLLNTGEKIYIGLYGELVINGAAYKCDKESLDELQSYDKRIFKYEPTIEVSSSALKDLDFTGCTVGVTDNWGLRIVGYMPDDVKGKFVECIKNADISTEENEDFEGAVGGVEIYEITLYSGEKFYINLLLDDELSINGVPYKCDETDLKEIRELKIGVTYKGAAY